MAKRCEQDLEVVSEWQRDAASQLATAAVNAPKADDALNAAKFAARSAADEARRSTEATALAQKSLQERLLTLSQEVSQCSAVCKEVQANQNKIGPDGETVDVQDLFHWVALGTQRFAFGALGC